MRLLNLERSAGPALLNTQLHSGASSYRKVFDVYAAEERNARAFGGDDPPKALAMDAAFFQAMLWTRY
jgi:hypothetical protein